MSTIEKVPTKELFILIEQCELKGCYRILSCLLELQQLRSEKLLRETQELIVNLEKRA